MSFTAHAVVATALSRTVVQRLMPAGDLGAPLHAETLCEIGLRLRMRPGTIDIILVAVGPGADHGLLMRADEEVDAEVLFLPGGKRSAT